MKKPTADDLVLVLGKVSDTGNPESTAYRVLRRRTLPKDTVSDVPGPRDEVRIEVGELRTLEEGKPLEGEVVRLTPREESPRLFDVRTEYEPSRRTAPGPARVATTDYRKGWDKIWGRRTAGTLPN